MRKLLTILTSSSAIFLIAAGLALTNNYNIEKEQLDYNNTSNTANHQFSDGTKKRLTKIGYYHHNGHVRISQIPPSVEVIDAELPEVITSLRTAFLGSTNNIRWEKKWNTKNVTDMNSVFYNRSYFNSADISDWDTSKVTDMGEMFYGVKSFNQDLSKWDVSKVKNMDKMFEGAENFNNNGKPLDWGEKTKNTSSMKRMFKNSTMFNQDISNWNISNVKSFEQMFEGAENFNNNDKPLDWGEKTKNSNNMKSMFKGAKKFNQDISSWNISNVKSFEQMFEDANSFNNNDKPLNWSGKLKNANNMSRMFKNAKKFTHDLSDWLMSTVVNKNDFGLDDNKQPKWLTEGSQPNSSSPSSPSTPAKPNKPLNGTTSNVDDPTSSSPTVKPDINSETSDVQPPVTPPTKPEKPELPNADNETIDKNDDIKDNIENPKIDNSPYKIPSAKPNTIIKPNSPSAGIIAGAILGSFTILGISVGTSYYYRKNLKNFYLNSATKTKNLYFKSKEKIKDKISKIKSKK
ncbi:BspA family leucine-rich repeat surface protein [Mycoplasma mycoides subsp. capri]|uniref:BspA family leucine-rich repeat surface protein n=1 Tax=Mycoplasma mycoides TaxID=2102 RepID=UPI00223FB7AE|nr:BspA family leucine-rich repeat surface protein [Mycoplasma mycoides]QVJ96159.1 BspA family leucine-rich repeat surface protein [Mycoplasma mycoides subsp. capri]QVJ97053.1 BspA family leucine-rich repeat surface protein [Mycoplasma mycoides subsp. capri]QVK00034.1 BspA family leucine-rich repeat surface protein [Mycoplasma mycoides subsp. capri]QVK00917.1 BspA family leucine-rich repeat surface protein [Mycoplasma mycoides subsp. capri]